MLNENQYFVTDNNELVDNTTGEIISLEEIKKAKQKKIINEVAKANGELNELGIKSGLIISEYKGESYTCVQVKSNYKFDKMFRTSMQDVIKDEKLSITSMALLLAIMPFIIFPSNMVVIKNCQTLDDIGNLIGIKHRATYKAIKELCDKQIICRIKHGKICDIYINPYLISTGLVVEKSTVEMFINSKYNTVKEVRRNLYE